MKRKRKQPGYMVSLSLDDVARLRLLKAKHGTYRHTIKLALQALEDAAK